MSHMLELSDHIFMNRFILNIFGKNPADRYCCSVAALNLVFMDVMGLCVCIYPYSPEGRVLVFIKFSKIL